MAGIIEPGKKKPKAKFDFTLSGLGIPVRLVSSASRASGVNQPPHDWLCNMPFFSKKNLSPQAVSATASGKPSADAKTMKTLAGKPHKSEFGTAYQFFKGGDAGIG